MDKPSWVEFNSCFWQLLESEIEKSNYENKYMYKRDVGPQIEKIETAEESEDRPMLQEKAIQKQ